MKEIILAMKVVILLLGLMARTALCQISGAEMEFPAGKPGPGGVEELWFNQTLDHFSSGPPTYWKQRYMVNEFYWNSYGKRKQTTVFLRIGGEGRIGRSWMTGGAWFRWAMSYGALLFQLEHRFYGDSHPTEDVSDANLKYLTSEQAIQDIKTFIEAINKQYNLTTKSKWFLFGGSYPGNLVAWSRLKLPGLIYGGVSSSAPLQIQKDFLEYNEVIRDNLELYYPGCATATTKAVKAIQNIFKNGTSSDIKRIKDKFNVCEGFNHKVSTNVNLFFHGIQFTFARAVQYNEIGNQYERIGYVCKYMRYTAVKDPVERLAALQRSVTNRCFNAEYYRIIDFSKQFRWDSVSVYKNARQWLWQTCNEFGYYQTSGSPDSFFSDTLPISFFEQQCKDVFGSNFNGTQLSSTISRLNENYQGWNIKVENVVFVQGSVDPWHPLGMIRNHSPKSPLIFINGTTHTQDMGESWNDSPSLARAKRQIQTYLNKWNKA